MMLFLPDLLVDCSNIEDAEHKGPYSYEELQNIYNEIKDELPFKPELGIILGSGLGNYAKVMDVKKTIKYTDIKGFPVSTVSGHEGQFVFGYINEVPIVAMQGRIHLYEGYSVYQVVLPVRIMGMMGIKDLLITNAAGGIADSLNPGDLMIITDQNATYVPNPLIGPNIDEFGERFPDMSEIYKNNLIDLVKSASAKTNIPVKEGIYLQLTGPSYETPAEIRAFKNIADAVGMSTAIEAIAATHMGINVVGVSCITNKAAGISDKPLSHKEVLQTGDKVAADFKTLVTEFISEYKLKGINEKNTGDSN